MKKVIIVMLFILILTGCGNISEYNTSSPEIEEKILTLQPGDIIKGSNNSEERWIYAGLLNENRFSLIHEKRKGNSSSSVNYYFATTLKKEIKIPFSYTEFVVEEINYSENTIVIKKKS